jgi:alkanesulfonate monooxygenase SsuD/methylene tetrahydromethanopterin reductase-like flavin-dependent oxidoreductase (luciferase family)
MKQIWSGSTPVDGAVLIGPAPVQPGGPELLIGGVARATARRLAHFGDGYIASGDPASSLSLFRTAEKAWESERRLGRPRFVATAYFALGPNVSDRGMAYLRDYYRFLGPAADQIAGALLSSPDAVRAALRQYSEIGVDELILWPTVPDLDQVARLGNLIG